MLHSHCRSQGEAEGGLLAGPCWSGDKYQVRGGEEAEWCIIIYYDVVKYIQSTLRIGGLNDFSIRFLANNISEVILSFIFHENIITFALKLSDPCLCFTKDIISQAGCWCLHQPGEKDTGH